MHYCIYPDSINFDDNLQLASILFDVEEFSLLYFGLTRCLQLLSLLTPISFTGQIASSCSHKDTSIKQRSFLTPISLEKSFRQVSFHFFSVPPNITITHHHEYI